MDLLELDERLENDIKQLERNLIDYEKSVKEASDLKYTFENQTKEIMTKFEEKIRQLNVEFISDKELTSESIKSFNEYYKKVVTLFNDIELKKNVFELNVNQMNQAYEKKWRDLQVQNENTLSKLNEKVTERINKLEEENKRTLTKIIADLTVNEKEIVHSKKEITECIQDEVNKVLGKKNSNDESIEAINSDISKLKRESERSLIDLSGEFFKETTRAEDKYRELARNFNIFIVISSVLFIILLIWR